MNRSIRFYCIGHAAMLLLMALSVTRAEAQNLVPNGDFESKNNCPSILANIDYSAVYGSFSTVKGWVRPTLTGTSDYMNACATQTYTSTPKNFIGTLIPHSGSAYAGMIMFQSGGYHEYISARLTKPLIRDSIYQVRMFAGTAGGGDYSAGTGHIESMIAVNEIGLSFSDTLPYKSTFTLGLNLPYHLKSDTSVHMKDTTRWYEISGLYKARGGEAWITIGSFNRNPVPPYTVVNQGSGTGVTGYTYIDDVSVVPRPKGHITAGIGDDLLQQIRLGPNPVGNTLNIIGLQQISGLKSLSVASPAGKLMQQIGLTGPETTIDISELPPGTYFLTLTTETGRASFRFLKL